jgi:hypothetical protein
MLRKIEKTVSEFKAKEKKLRAAEIKVLVRKISKNLKNFSKL